MKTIASTTLSRLIAAVMALILTMPYVRAHNLDTTATSISFAQDFVQKMAQRAAAEQPLIQRDDEFWVMLKTTPGPGTTTGVGGYQTFYVPDGVIVTDAAYVFPDSSDPRGFRNIPMKGQSSIAIGNGSIGQSSSPEFIGWELPGLNGLGYKHASVTATGMDRGTLAGVYADTGIFYSTDPRTVFNSYGMLKPPLIGPPTPMKNNSGDTVGEYYAENILNAIPRRVLGVMTLWDSYQLRAYGRSDVSPLLDENGRGNAPWGLANVVPGPESGYAWEFDYDAYQSTQGSASDKLRAAIKIGPWNRIKYPGSQISQDQAGLISNVLGQAGIDASLMGIPANAIPPDANAIRFAIGQLELGRPEQSAVKVRIIDEPALDCWGMHADAFGGDAGGTDGGKDHIWRYFDPTVVTLTPCTFIQKVASKSLVAPGETFYFDITFANNGTDTLPNVTITDTLPNGLVHVSAVPAPATVSGSSFTWNIGTMEPGDLVTIRQYVRATGSGTLFNTATARSNGAVIGVSQQSVEVGVRAILDKSKSVTPSSAAPGDTVTYTLDIENIGTGLNGTPLRVREFLPAGFTFVSLNSATLNGATIASPTIVLDAADPKEPLFTISQGIQPGKKLLISFTARVGLEVQPGTYWNYFQLEYEGKIIPPIPEAPVTVAGGKIGDTVWRDWNGNSAQDPGEQGISGVTVELYEADGVTLITTTTTDANGHYYFPGLVAGTYVVKVVQPANTTQTGDPDGTFDNQHQVVLGNDQQYLTADFGYQPAGAGVIGDLVFEDVGNDGVFTSGSDSGISGVTVSLYADVNGDGVLTPGVDALIGTKTTNGGGLYSFTNLAEGFDYLAVVDAADSALLSYFSAVPYQTSTANSQVIDNLAGSYLNADFGFWKVEPSSIGDQVFIDADGNGLYNTAIDSPLGGVTVSLLRDGSPVTTTTSAPDGTYLFDNLGPGNYTVVVNASSMAVPAGYAPSVGQYSVSLNPGDDFLDADFPFAPLISKSVDKAFAQTGDTLSFGVNVNYAGSSLLSDAQVRDYLPNGTSFAAAGQGGTLVTFTPVPGASGLDAGSAGGATVTLNSSSGIDDTWLEENSPDRNYGTAPDLRIDSETSRPEHALVRFTLPTNLPDDAVITSATLKLTKLSGNTIDIIAHQADNDWAEGALNGTNGVASWNNRLTATPWDIPGGDFIEDVNDPVVSSGTATGDRTWEVAHIVQNWIDGAENHGFLLKHPLENTGNNQNVFASSENTTVASRPTLTITYTSTARPATSNTLTVSQSVFALGSPVTVTMTLQSSAAVSNIVPSALAVRGGSAAVSGPSPASLNLAANTPATFTWTVTPDTLGEYSFSADATASGSAQFRSASSASIMVSPNGENQYVVWDVGSNEPGTIGTTATSNNLYAFRGADALSFWAYNTTNSNWNSPLDPADTPAGVTVKEGGALTNDGVRYIYALRGDNSRVFLRYDTSTGTWNDAGIADLPATTDKAVLKGGSLAYINGQVYAFPGNGSRQFWRYSIADNSWTRMTDALQAIGTGGGLTTDGTNLYAIRGATKKEFMRYNVAANTWTALAPFADNVGDGGGLVYANGAIYVLRGDAKTTFRRYNIASNTWTTLADAPANIDDGGAIAFDGVAIYVLRGKTNVFYRYDIAANTWTTLANTPANIGWGGALTYLATGNVSRVSATASPTFVMGLSQVAVRMTVRSDDPQSGVTPTTPAYSATSGITATFGSPTLVSPDNNISGTGDPVIYEWIASVTPGTNPGDITFTVGSSLGATAATNSVIVSPTLTYTALVGANPPSVIRNTAFINETGGTITNVPSNTTETATSGSIGDFVWADLDADGVQDAGEYGLAGVTVRLYAADGITLIATDVTDANGSYRFFGLGAGSYVVAYDASTVPAGYFATTPLTVPVSLTAGQQFDAADFGLTNPPAGTGSIGDFVWIDSNSNGIQNDAEPGIAGVSVILERFINGQWVQTATTTTDANGAYLFSGLSAAGYRVTIDTESQITSPYAQGTFALGDVMAPTYDEDGISTPHVALVTLATDSTVIATTDFGYNWSGSIGDFVWWDYNTDGLQNESPLVGIANARVQLYFDHDFDGVFDRILGDYEILRVFTNASGFYHIPNLPPGNYYVDVYEDSIVTGGVRNVVPTGVEIIPVNLLPGTMQVETADFGYYVGARVEATVFWDVNHNGIRDGGEPLLQNITVTLTGTDKSGNPVTAIADSDAQGHVVFLVPEGDYTISYDTADITANFPALGTPTTPVSFEFTAYAGDDGVRHFDFGVDNTGAIGDTIFADINGDGSQSGSEPGLAGVTVKLYFDANGDGVIGYGAGDLLLETAVTDENGKYHFVGLDDTTGPARYIVEVLTATLPEGYETVPTAYPVGAVTLTSRYSTALVNGEVINIVDFGYPPVPDVYHSISGTIYHDNGNGGGTSSDGLKNGSEPGLAGIGVRIEVDSDGSGSYDQSYIVFTDSSGFYSLGGIPQGANVRLTVNESTLPSNAFVQTGDPNGAPLSNVWTITDIQADANNLDFGYVEDLGSIAGTVVKGNGNGIADNGEPRIEGVTVTLTWFGRDGIPGTGDDETRTTTTDGNGGYKFTDLFPGGYEITTTIPSGYLAYADADGINPNSINLNLTLGQDVTGRDFEYQNATLSGTLWSDSNADGTRGSGEPLLGNVNVFLDLDGNGLLDAGEPSTTTNAGGFYEFQGLVSGSYQVRVDPASLPGGSLPSFDVDGISSANVAIISLSPNQNRTEVDFGYYKNGAISGTVWEDTDNDNLGDKPIEGVILSLVDGSGTPVLNGSNQPATATSAADGSYSFGNLKPGSYGVVQTQPAGYVSLYDKDGGDPDEIRPITVIAGQTNTLNDFVEISGCPDTWADWKQLHPGETAAGNPDADAYDNFSEFAFAMPYDRGTGSEWLGSTAWVIQPSATIDGTIEGVFIRPKGAWLNVTYTLEYAATLGNPTVWLPIVINTGTNGNATTVDNGDCTETVTIHGLETLTGLTGGEGFVRIRADLDDDGGNNGDIDHTSFTEVEGWTVTDLEICCQTYNNPYLREAVFTGTISSVNGQELSFADNDALDTLLASGGSFYLEVTSGENEGHRFDVVSAAGNIITVANDADLHAAAAPFNTLIGAAPASLEGDTVSVRRHWTLDEVLLATGFGATGSQSSADLVQVFADGQGQWADTFWLYDENDADPATARWVSAADAGMADQGATVIQPGRGLFFNNRSAATSVMAYGEVRPNDFIRPHAAGNNFVGGGYPIAQSANGTGGRAMSLTTGFYASLDFKTADSIFIWKADSDPKLAGYHTYYLFDARSIQPNFLRWVKVGDSQANARDEEVILHGNRAAFVRTRNGVPQYTSPSPWGP
jgi:uncharacterized repeat protein (TIGR01451 family)